MASQNQITPAPNSDPWSVHASSLDDLTASMGGSCPVFLWPAANPMPPTAAKYNILPGSVKFKRDNESGGFGLDSDLKFTCTTAQFTNGGGSLPDSRQLISYNGKLFRIDRVIFMANGWQISIEANDAAQKL